MNFNKSLSLREIMDTKRQASTSDCGAKVVRRTIKSITVAGCFLLASNLLAGRSARKVDSWNNLRHVTHKRHYIFLSRDGSCVTGKIAAVRHNSITIKQTKRSDVQLERSNVLRVTTDPSVIIIYSGRSSWSDVEKFASYPPTFGVRITLKSGGKYKGKFKITGKYITMIRAGGKIKISKKDISTLNIECYAPMSEANEYWVDECGLLPVCLLNVSLWPNFLGIGGKMRVRLYDSSLPEDDRPVKCEAHP